LRYGENPHQSAAAYHRVSAGSASKGALTASQLQGKELSYNNLLDADAAIRVGSRFADTTAVVVKHAIPCGVACRDTTAMAVQAALECDPVSAFGGIVAVNRTVDVDAAAALTEIFLEVVISHSFTEEARSILSGKKNLRLLELPIEQWAGDRAMGIRSITGGLLFQDEDTRPDAVGEWRTVTKVKPSARTMIDLQFAWEVCRSVRSNAIVLAQDRMAIGIGPGQPNRKDSVRIAVQRAGDRTAGSVLASDAFFPFADGVEVALEAGVTAVIQPGGSVRDAEVIEACDRAGVPMVFTGVRHFLH
jgi:phosphoribosylaminoimidazolecarboxamide formyltransferase/IMP cyclohydrolase